MTRNYISDKQNNKKQKLPKNLRLSFIVLIYQAGAEVKYIQKEEGRKANCNSCYNLSAVLHKRFVEMMLLPLFSDKVW
jgi:hypothetical protein